MAGLAVVVRFPSEDRANAGYHIEGSDRGPAGQRWWRGTGPRMIAQPAVHVADGFAVDGTDPSPVARAIAAGLARAG